MTLLVYAALGAVLFFLILQLQTVSGYGALAAGARDPADHDLHAVPRLRAAAGWRTRIGPRIPMTVGPLVMARRRRCCCCGSTPTSTTGSTCCPAVTVFGLGLALMVAPLTATVLAAAPDEHAGIASGVNNAVARTGSLLAVAALPVAVGLGGARLRRPGGRSTPAYGTAMLSARCCWSRAALLSWLTIRHRGARRR